MRYQIPSVSCISRPASMMSDEHCKGQNAIQILALGCCLSGYLARFSKRLYHSLIEYKTKPLIRRCMDSFHLPQRRSELWLTNAAEPKKFSSAALVGAFSPCFVCWVYLLKTKRLKFLIRISKESRLGSDKLIDANMIIYR